MNFFISVVLDGALLGAVYLWHAYGLDSARGFFVGVMWVFTVFAWLAVFTAGKGRGPRNPLRWLHGIAFAIAVTVAAIWMGATSLAVAYFVAWILNQAKHLGAGAA
ncbi:hypothetical protein [Burkholderia sp. PU8-34]